MAKKDIHHLTEKYQKFLIKIRSRKLINKEVILRYLQEAELGKTILKGQKKKISHGRLLRVGLILEALDTRWLKKKFKDVTEKEMETFILKMEKGEIHSWKKKPLAPETQVTIKKFLRKFYKWLLGNSEVYPDLVKWIDTSCERTEIKPVYFEDLVRLDSRIPSIKHKALLWVLFDCGFRIEELLNIRLRNIKQENEEISIRIEISKTKPRTVFIGIKEAKDSLLEYLKEHKDKEDPEAFLFNSTYGAVRKFICVNSKKILKRTLTPHMFRHGSASYYAKFLTEYQMCNRYGWSIGSKTPSRYIEFTGLTDKNTPELIKKDTIGKYESENRELKQELTLIKDRISKVDEVMNKLISNQKILDMLSSEALK